MVGLLLVGFILWLSSPLIVEFFEYIEPTVLSPIGEWICNLLGAKRDCSESVRPFVVSEYLARVEEASLDILEAQRPVDKVICLWWGLDGLRLNEDGSFEWINRRKDRKPQEKCVFPTATGALSAQLDMIQSSQATREQIFGLKMQLEMMNFNAALQRQMQNLNSSLPTGTIQWPGYYARLVDCCCDRLRRGE